MSVRTRCATIFYSKVYVCSELSLFRSAMEITRSSNSALDELKEYTFVSFVRRKKTKQLVKALFSGYSLFVPFNMSLPMTMKRADIRLVRKC